MTKAQTTKIKALMKVLRSVREKCLDCSAYSIYEVKNCVMSDCRLFPWKEGTLNYSGNFTRGKNDPMEKNGIVEGRE